MHTSTRMIHSARALAFLVSFGALLLSCNSTDTFAPPATTCDERNSGSFTIDNPEVGHVYVWGGTGHPGAGDLGQLPGATNLYWPIDVSFEPATGKPIVLDHNNHRVLGIDANGKFEKLIGQYFGEPNPIEDPLPKLGTNTALNHPTHVSFAPDGRMIVSAWHNSVVLQMDMSTRMVNMVCGTGGRCFNGDPHEPLTSCLDLPVCTQFHPITGELYISDQANQLIRKIDSTDTLRVVAGTPPTPNGAGGLNYYLGYSGDGGPAIGAQMNFGRGQTTNPNGRFCFDAAGNIYIADTNNNAIRIITVDGNIDTFAGLGPGMAGYSGDGGPANMAQLNAPRDVVVDTDGSVFIADTGNHVIRKVAPDGTISTAVGVFRPETAAAIAACALHDEQGALPNEVHLTLPWGIEIDPQGNLWIADTYNQVIRILYR
jgi:hypothetical protein